MNDLNKLIENYKQSVFQLADHLHQVKNEKGWKNCKELSGLDLHKLQWFLTVGSYINRTHNTMPETYVEVSGLSPEKAKKYLTLAVKDNLTPCQLRKVIRTEECTIKPKKKAKKVEVNQFGVVLNSLRTQLGYMKSDEKARAKKLLETL